MTEFGPNSPLSDDGCQPVQPAANWATMQALPWAVGLLLLPWGKAAEGSDLLVFPQDRLQKEGRAIRSRSALGCGISVATQAYKRGCSSFDLCDHINDMHSI